MVNIHLIMKHVEESGQLSVKHKYHNWRVLVNVYTALNLIDKLVFILNWPLKRFMLSLQLISGLHIWALENSLAWWWFMTAWCQPPLNFSSPHTKVPPWQETSYVPPPPPSPIFLEQKSLFLDLLISFIKSFKPWPKAMVKLFNFSKCVSLTLKHYGIMILHLGTFSDIL